MSRQHVRFVCKLGWEKCDLCNRDAHPDLFICTICNGAESSLPTDCPGRKMTGEEEEMVQQGRLDFKDGVWIRRGE